MRSHKFQVPWKDINIGFSEKDRNNPADAADVGATGKTAICVLEFSDVNVRAEIVFNGDCAGSGIDAQRTGDVVMRRDMSKDGDWVDNDAAIDRTLIDTSAKIPSFTILAGNLEDGLAQSGFEEWCRKGARCYAAESVATVRREYATEYVVGWPAEKRGATQPGKAYVWRGITYDVRNVITQRWGYGVEISKGCLEEWQVLSTMRADCRDWGSLDVISSYLGAKLVRTPASN
ncbi:uncharacterized protein MELLADRAFT_103550 [Melampsora larici-populina 98AG31]|uniref:Uncharacterized protein n=1 Tax=Melampsora larici-populina (strain 98AG31 / pathotype 3-4-7) TaxID=747676 RepID=F4RBQ0_MELLP|nr:uncharacterized protein MELLADRAFT_103550 [Melampsora larici-populina 98AG31]EGG10298.1 hypothetical protein MELLADRAFT_103550 [Melampsora larici-populina 98AG31]